MEDGSRQGLGKHHLPNLKGACLLTGFAVFRSLWAPRGGDAPIDPGLDIKRVGRERLRSEAALPGGKIVT